MCTRPVIVVLKVYSKRMVVESGVLQLNSQEFFEIDDFRSLHQYNHLATNPRWPIFIESIYGHRAFYVSVKKGRKVIAYAVGNLFEFSPSGRRRLILGAFLDYGVKMHLTGSSVEEMEFIEKEMLSQMTPDGIVTKEISPFRESSMHTQAIIELSKLSLETLEKSITSRARNDLRQFEMYQGTIESGSKFLPEFYMLYEKRMKEFGTPAHSLKFFEELLSTFDSKVITAFDQNGFASAASFSVCEDGAWLHLYAAGNRSLRKGNPGDRVLWEELKMGVEKQAQSFWLGRSIRNSDIEKYKEKWNPQFYSTSEHLGTRIAPLLGFQVLNNENKKSIFANIWTHLPNSFTRVSNSSVRKYIP